MKETAKRFLSIAGSAMTIFLLAGMTFVVFDRDAKTAPALLFDYQSDTPTLVQVFFDVGTGFEEQYSSRQFVPRQSAWREIRLDLPKARIRQLLLHPGQTAGTFWIRNLRVVDTRGTVRLVIPPAKIRPVNEILSMTERNGELEIQIPSDANDPIVEIPLDSAIDLRGVSLRRIAPLLAGWMLFWTAVVAVLYYAHRFLQRNAIFLALCRKPTAVICLAAITGTLVSTSPVVFQGKSFMSPNLQATLLFYDRFPTLPNYSDSTTEDCYGADTGAMEWQHFPLTVAQERAIKEFGEFPLWNRYNSAGTTMIGQGQMMLGDPLDWVMWLVGVDALTFDIKFVLLRLIFALALGLAVFVITCAIAPSAMVAITAPFIGYFIYQVNHPLIFTLCYAPLILLAWLKVIYAEDERSRLRWVAGLMLANWLVINSGTVKDAYMSIAVLNAIGILHFMLEKSRFGGKFKTWSGLLAMSGVCFLMIAAPLWGTFLDTLRSGISNYNSPGVRQYPFWFFLGFADNFFYLLRTDSYSDSYSPAVNALLFVGFLHGIFCTPHLESPKARRSTVVLTLGCGMLIAIAFGLIPAKWLLAIPYVNNIRHVDTTFSTILVVPVSILAGIGFASIDLQRKKRVDPIVVSVLMALVFLFALSFAQSGGLRLKQFTIYSLAVLPAALCAPRLIISLLNGKLSFAGIGVCLIAILLVLGRGAMYTDTPDRFVFNPHERISLTYRPELVVRLTAKLREEPTRIVGLGNVLFPGYNATLGLENISGPDGMYNKPYRELTGTLKLPYDESNWRILLNWRDLATYKNALDVLGVGFVLSSVKTGEATSASYVDDDGPVYAYSRPSAWPRAFYTGRVVLYDNVQSLAERISTGDGQPLVAVTQRSVDTNAVLRRLVDKPAGESATLVKARDYSLTNNSTGFTIDAPAAGVIYLGETDEPGDFIVTINGKRVPYLTANHAFKAVLVDGPGEYRVTFRYWPAHLTSYLWLSFGGLVLWLAALILFWKYRQREGADTASPPRELMASLAGTRDDRGSKTPGVTWFHVAQKVKVWISGLAFVQSRLPDLRGSTASDFGRVLACLTDRRHAPVSILMLCLLLLGIGIHQKTNRAIAPPIYDAMSYYAKGARVWTEWGMGRLVNPFNVGPPVRPPGTMLLSSPLGFSRDFRAFFFRSIYYPIVLFVVGFWLLAESRAYQPGQSWVNLTGALTLASLPMFYQFERNPAFTSPYDWGYVDCFVAALAALATALLLVSVRRCSIRLATVGSLTGALTLLVKPVGLLLMPLFYFFWITELLIVHGPIFARWREDKLLRNYSIWSATLLAVFFFGTAVVCFKSEYLSQRNLMIGYNGQKILIDMYKNVPFWNLVVPEFQTSFGWHWFYMSVAATLLLLGSIAFRVLRRHGRREDFRFLVVLATLCLGIVWWIRFAGPQIRYVYPFVLTFLVVALPDILGKAAVHLPKWSRRPLAALCMAPLAVVIALLFAETPSIQWQHILGVNLSSGHFREEVEMGNLLVQEAQSQARNLNIYVLGTDERPGVVEAQGIYRNLLKPEAPTFQLQRPNDWIRPIMVRRKELVLSDFLLFYPVRDSNRLRAPLARQVVNDRTTEMDVFSAWLTLASEDQGLRVVSESVLRLVKVVDHVKLDQAFGKLMAQHRWQDLFYAENNEPCF